MLEVGIGAIVFSIWSVILFFGKSIGLSMLLFFCPFAYFFIHILEKNNKVKNKKAKLLIVPILLLSGTYCIYNNRFFNALNLVVVTGLVSIMVLALLGEKFEFVTNIIGRIFSMFVYSMDFIGDAIGNFVDSIKEKLNIKFNIKGKEKVLQVLKAILITGPIVLIITILLSTADDIFGNIFIKIFEYILNQIQIFSIKKCVLKLIWILLAFIYLIGIFYYVCYKFEIKEKVKEIKKKVYDNFSVKMIFASLNTIYLLFCYIQVKSLLMKNTTLNYAQYARKGFFQLMIVSLINLVTILIAKKRQNKEDSKTNRFIDYMSLIMIVFTFIIGLSACMRMYLYESAYGYTLLRLLVYCILFTELLLFIPTIMYVLNRKINLLKSYMIIITVVYIGMNFANFDRVIATRNVDRYLNTGKIDLEYLVRNTGTDAVEPMLKILDDNQDEKVKQKTEKYLKDMYYDIHTYSMDFRDYNYGKVTATKLIADKLDVE